MKAAATDFISSVRDPSLPLRDKLWISGRTDALLQNPSLDITTEKMGVILNFCFSFVSFSDLALPEIFKNSCQSELTILGQMNQWSNLVYDSYIFCFTSPHLMLHRQGKMAACTQRHVFYVYF